MNSESDLETDRCNRISQLGQYLSRLITHISQLGILPSRLVRSKTDLPTLCLYH